jgi:hypothetical protein
VNPSKNIHHHTTPDMKDVTENLNWTAENG